jgi:hypothetical protein
VQGGRLSRVSWPVPFGWQPWAVDMLGAAAGVMVTASHNPKQDDGYKVYWSNGCQVRTVPCPAGLTWVLVAVFGRPDVASRVRPPRRNKALPQHTPRAYVSCVCECCFDCSWCLPWTPWWRRPSLPTWLRGTRRCTRWRPWPRCKPAPSTATPPQPSYLRTSPRCAPSFVVTRTRTVAPSQVCTSSGDRRVTATGTGTTSLGREREGANCVVLVWLLYGRCCGSGFLHRPSHVFVSVLSLCPCGRSGIHSHARRGHAVYQAGF